MDTVAGDITKPYLFFEDPDRVKEEGPVMSAQHADGVQVGGPDLLDGLQLVVAVV